MVPRSSSGRFPVLIPVNPVFIVPRRGSYVGNVRCESVKFLVSSTDLESVSTSPPRLNFEVSYLTIPSR